MRVTLFPFQETALAELHEKINKAHLMWSEKDPQVISFSAPTGSGKTIIMTALFEEILYGGSDNIGIRIQCLFGFPIRRNLTSKRD
jgi:Lhr-like helicases